MQKPQDKFIYDPPQGELNVIYNDENLIVLSKPAKLLSVPGRAAHLNDSLETRVHKQFPTSRIVHRLDMETSGVMVMALNSETHRNLGLQFERRKVEKEYTARVNGHVSEDEGTIDLPLRCDWPNRPLQMVDLSHGKEAITHWRVLERERSGVTRVSLKPITGRSHQLRVHMKEIGHPILGDDFYAPTEIYNMTERMQLHAHKLTIHNPENGEKMQFVSDNPF